MIEEIDHSGLSLDGLVVVHNGVIVVEEYYYIYKESTLHETYSVTKSVISALVGIALNQGCIESIEDPVLPYFPEMVLQNVNEQKESLTIKDFLTMSSGLAYNPDEMYASLDWAQYTLDQPLIYQPGESWFYSNGGPQVLSALISQACEMDTVEFAKLYLFDPLGIKIFAGSGAQTDIPMEVGDWSYLPATWRNSDIYIFKTAYGMGSRSCRRIGWNYPDSAIIKYLTRWSRGIYIMAFCGGSMVMGFMQLMDIKDSSFTLPLSRIW